MAKNRIRQKISIFILLCSGLLKAHATSPEVSPSCLFTDSESFSCGDTTLANGDTVHRVPKAISSEDAWWMKGVPELEHLDQRLTCATPDCLSHPCENGGTCTETFVGFHCMCPSQYYGETCACSTIHQSDAGSTRSYTYLTVPSGMTSFEFEVRATKGEAYIGLFRNIGEQYKFEIGVGAYGNTRAAIIHPSRGIKSLTNAVMALSGISTYDRFHLSFNDGVIRIKRADSNIVLEFSDPYVPEIRAIGVWIGWGSEGYWKFPTLC